MVIFIDALGWEVLRNRKFLESELPHRRKLRSVFGFSSACVPSILSGRQPRDHGHWSYFFYSPKTSPFKPLKLLSALPGWLTERGRVRHLISKIIGRLLGFTGYFQLYNLPFRHAGLFDHCEKNDIFKAGGMNRGGNIFDCLEGNEIPYHVSDWHLSENENLAACEADIRDGGISFAFLYMAAMDGLLHQVGKDSARVDEKLEWYEQKLRHLFAVAAENYDDVRLFICSDHGMATVGRHVDLMREIEALPLTFGKDYVAVYDSTMARFWFPDPAARASVEQTLAGMDCGRVLDGPELAELGCDFDGDQFGELIFLLDAGSIIVPSHMGLKPITGMHGYHPDHPDSDAVLLSNAMPGVDVSSITDIFRLMGAEAGVVQTRGGLPEAA
jgi:predicted AlkP superfamily pyrophosphatase or phosphodiesterase